MGDADRDSGDAARARPAVGDSFRKSRLSWPAGFIRHHAGVPAVHPSHVQTAGLGPRADARVLWGRVRNSSWLACDSTWRSQLSSGNVPAPPPAMPDWIGLGYLGRVRAYPFDRSLLPLAVREARLGTDARFASSPRRPGPRTTSGAMTGSMLGRQCSVCSRSTPHVDPLPRRPRHCPLAGDR